MIDQIAATVAQNESLGDCEVRVLMIPFAGYDNVASKSLINLNARRRSERIFIKISNSQKLSRFLQGEADSLNACAALGIESIPKVLASGMIEGRYFIAERFVPGPKMHSSPSYLNTALSETKDWLAVLYERTRGEPVEPARLIRRAGEYAGLASGFFELGDCLGMMEKLSPQTPIPTHRIHGDFWHGNILLKRGGGVCVTDFAFSAPGEPPIDHLDLVCDYDTNVFLDPKRLRSYVGMFPIKVDELPFLLLYALIRKIGLKVERRKALYEELLLNDLESSMGEISEVGFAKRFFHCCETRQS